MARDLEGSRRLTVHAWFMPDGWHHGLWVGEEMVHCVSGVSEHYLIVVFGNHVLLPRHHSWVVIVIKQLQQVIYSQLYRHNEGIIPISMMSAST